MYFFMIMYLRAFPNVWSSASNSKDAAVSFAPGSYMDLSVSVTKAETCVCRPLESVDH